MNKNKLLYETPVVKTLVVRVEGSLLTGSGELSVGGNRGGTYVYVDGLDSDD